MQNRLHGGWHFLLRILGFAYLLPFSWVWQLSRGWPNFWGHSSILTLLPLNWYQEYYLLNDVLTIFRIFSNSQATSSISILKVNYHRNIRWNKAKNVAQRNLVGVYDNLRKHHDQIIFDWQVTANENKLRNHILLLNVQFFGHLFDKSHCNVLKYICY